MKYEFELENKNIEIDFYKIEIINDEIIEIYEKASDYDRCLRFLGMESLSQCGSIDLETNVLSYEKEQEKIDKNEIFMFVRFCKRKKICDVKYYKKVIE